MDFSLGYIFFYPCLFFIWVGFSTFFLIWVVNKDLKSSN